MKDNRLSIRLDHEVLQELMEVSKRKGDSITKLINKFCREGLCAHKELSGAKRSKIK